MIIWGSCLASWRLTILPSWYMNRFSVSTILSQTCCHCQEKHVPVGFQGRNANVMTPHKYFNGFSSRPPQMYICLLVFLIWSCIHFIIIWNFILQLYIVDWRLELPRWLFFHCSFCRLDRRLCESEADGVWGGDGRWPAQLCHWTGKERAIHVWIHWRVELKLWWTLPRERICFYQLF